MPYNRYDSVNRFDSKGRKKNEKIGVKVVLLIVIPFVIIGIVILGIILGLQTAGADNTNPVAPTSTEDEPGMVIPDSQLLIVVDDRHPLDKDYAPTLSPFGGVAVSSWIFSDLDHMIAAAADEGINISLTAGYVSYSDQGKLYEATFNKMKTEEKYSDVRAEAEAKKITPKAGSSESQTGLLIELSTNEKDFEGSKAEKWLDRNAVNYGFVLRYPEGKESSTGMAYNPRLFRYVGKEHALNMRRYGMTLNEYATHVAQH